jgi:hypothetical protein
MGVGCGGLPDDFDSRASVHVSALSDCDNSGGCSESQLAVGAYRHGIAVAHAVHLLSSFLTVSSISSSEALSMLQISAALLL